MKYLSIFTILALLALHGWAQDQVNFENIRFEAKESKDLLARTAVSFQKLPTITQNAFVLMGGGGGGGGIGYVALADITKNFLNHKYEDVNLIAHLGGGGGGGIGRQVEYIIRDGMLYRVNKNLEQLAAENVVISAIDQQLEDIELKDGFFVSPSEIQASLYEAGASQSSLVAIPVADVQRVFLNSGDVLENTAIQQQFKTVIEQSQMIEAVSIRATENYSHMR